MKKDKVQVPRERILDILELIDKEYRLALKDGRSEEANGFSISYAIVKLLLKD